MIQGTKKWSTLTAAVLLSLSSLALPQIAWATDYANYNAGSDSSAKNGDSTAVGGGATATIYATALGANAKATGQSSTVLGSHATASGTWAIAVGNAAEASGDSATAIGFDSRATYKDSVALGSGSSTSAEKTVSVGNSGLKRRIVNVADGTESSDVATFGQIALANQRLSLNTTATRTVNEKTVQNNQLVTNDGTVLATFEVGAVAENNTGFVSGGTVYDYLQTAISGAAYTGSDSITITDNTIRVKNMAQSDSTTEVANGTTKASGENAIAFGVDAEAVGNGVLAIGYHNQAKNAESAAIGYMNTVSGESAYAFGNNNTVNTEGSVAIGSSNVIGDDSLANPGTYIYAFGSGNTVTGVNAFVIGASNTISAAGANSFIIGSSNALDVQNTFVFGSDTGISTFATNSVVLGYQSTVEDANTVSVGSGRLQRKIVHVADGTASSDAATYGQIAKTVQELSLSTDTRETIGEGGDAKEIKNNQITTNDGTVLATFTKMTSVASDDYGFVSGADLYTETRDEITSTNYISQNSSTGANLNALDIAIGAKTSVEGLYTTGDSVETQLQNVGNKTIKSVTNAVSSGATETQKITVTTYDGNTSTIEIAGEGAVADGDKRLVNGDTVSQALATAINKNTYDSSDTISIEKDSDADHYTVRVKNMAQSTSDTEVTNGTTKAKGINAIAFGVEAEAGGNYAVAIGYKAKATKGGSTALGYSATAGGAYTTALGFEASASSKNATAVGYQAKASGDYATAIGDGATVNAGISGSVAIGYGSVASEGNTVSVGSTTTQRKIVNVAKGMVDTDAATYGQIAKAGQELSLSTDTRENIGEGGDAKEIKKNQITTNDGTVLATFTKMENVANDDYGFVSGADLYNETRDGITSTNYISQNSSTGANLSALDIAIGAKTSVADLYADTDSVETQLQNVGNKTIKSMSKATSNGSADTQKITVTTYDGNTSTIEIAGEGAVADGDVRLVNGDTVFDYVDGIKSGITTDVAKLISYDSENKTLHIGSGEDITANTVSFYAKDGTTTRKLTGITYGGDNNDAAAYGQIAKTGQTVSLATGSNTIVSNDGTTLATFQVGTVADGDTGFVNGGAVHDAIEKAKTDLSTDISGIQTDITAEDGSYVKKDNSAGANLNALDEAIGTVTKGNVIEASLDENGALKTSVAANLKLIDDKIGKIADKEGGYKAIDKDATISANLVALDEKLKEVSTDTTADLSDIEKKTKYKEAKADGTNAIGLGKDSNASGSDSISLGTSAEASDANTVALGNTAKATKANATALGNEAEASGESAVALGNGSKASGSDAISMGTGAEASGASALAMGKGANASKENALAFGTGAAASADGAAALGNGATAEGSNAISFGTGAAASKENALAFGNGAKASEKNTLAFGNGATASSENAMAFGNGASATGSGSVAIGSGSVASEENVVSFGAAGSERRLTNVAAGVNDTDAVNVGQMNSAIGENFNYLKSSLTRDINKVAAGSAALAALRPEGFDPDDKFSMAVGFGHYKSANAGAIGAFYKPNYDTTFSIGATVGDGETIMNMGVSFKLGSRGKRVPQTGAALSQEVASLRENNEALKKDNASQAKEIADLKADNERMKAQIAMILAKMELSDTVEKSVVK